MSLQVETNSEVLRTITLNDPQRRIPIGHDVRLRLRDVLSDSAIDDTVCAVVLTGTGGYFSAGGDICDQVKCSNTRLFCKSVLLNSADAAEGRTAFSEER